jgi:hypothetical protein
MQETKPMEEGATKQQRREQRCRNRRKMRVSGGSVRLLHTLLVRRAQQAGAAQPAGTAKGEAVNAS